MYGVGAFGVFLLLIMLSSSHLSGWNGNDHVFVPSKYEDNIRMMLISLGDFSFV